MPNDDVHHYLALDGIGAAKTSRRRRHIWTVCFSVMAAGVFSEFSEILQAGRWPVVIAYKRHSHMTSTDQAMVSNLAAGSPALRHSLRIFRPILGDASRGTPPGWRNAQRERPRSAGGDQEGLSRPAPNLLEAASDLLLWERLDQEAAAPVLDLSKLRGDPLADLNTENVQSFRSAQDAKREQDAPAAEDAAEWADGQRWQQTRAGLIELGIDGDGVDKMLAAVPQLLRLIPEEVLASAAAAANIVGIKGVVVDPKLLSYRADDISATNPAIATLCRLQPQLLTAAIDDTLQQRYTAAMLGSASEAQSKAERYVAADNAAASKNKGGSAKGVR